MPDSPQPWSTPWQTAWQELDAGHELDVLVARAIGMPCEWQARWVSDYVNPDGTRPHGSIGFPGTYEEVVERCARVNRDGRSQYRPTPIAPEAYSTDIAGAWRVVERMRGHPEIIFHNLELVAWAYNRTYASFDSSSFGDYTPETWAEANGEHATPLAICRAALLVLTTRPFPGTA